mmetsp:Transcript_8200/g.19546  ORF Transcript_8200/g.19546 Transcript_8200/m.19546 type:complete len:244 (+) Transcript_8200:182-913(+)
MESLHVLGFRLRHARLAVEGAAQQEAAAVGCSNKHPCIRIARAWHVHCLASDAQRHSGHDFMLVERRTRWSATVHGSCQRVVRGPQQVALQGFGTICIVVAVRCVNIGLTTSQGDTYPAAINLVLSTRQAPNQQGASPILRQAPGQLLHVHVQSVLWNSLVRSCWKGRAHTWPSNVPPLLQRGRRPGGRRIMPTVSRLFWRFPRPKASLHCHIETPAGLAVVLLGQGSTRTSERIPQWTEGRR